MSVHPEARFRADLESVIEAHSVVHKKPAQTWQDGLNLGNGDIAATVHGEPGRTQVLLNKGDIWDERADWLDAMYDPAEFDWQGTKEALARAVESGDWSEVSARPQPTTRLPEGRGRDFSGFKPAGYLDIVGDLAESADFEQKLSFYRATAECSTASGDSNFAYTAYAHADHNLIAIDISTDDPGSWPLSLQLHRDLVPFRENFKPDPDIADPVFGGEAEALWMTMGFPDGFAFAVVARVPDMQLSLEPEADRITAQLPPDASRRQLSVRLTIVTGQGVPPEELVHQGRRQLALIDEAGLLASHQNWWADFWARGWISLPDKLIENLRYAEIYKMASCSRKGGQAPGQLAHWCGFPDPPWRGDYHTNINIQENYWPIYTANRPELGWPFYDLYLGILDYTIEDTWRYTGQPGARFVRGHGRSGRPHGRSDDWELWPGGGAWLCAHFWWHYQFTGDTDFLRDSYRMFRACLDYFLAYVGEPDEEGRYNIIPSQAHEQSKTTPEPGAGGNWGKNSSYDLGILRDHLMRTIRASQILGVDEAERWRWRQVLDNLAPLPVSSEGWFEEWEGFSLWASHRHLSPLYPIYPGEEIHADSDPDMARIGRQSVLRFLARGSHGYTGFSFGWMAACAARMDMADEALSCIRDHIRAFVNVNGGSLFGPSRFPGLAPYPGGRRGTEWKQKLPNCESGGSFCAGINELLLRSPSGNLGSQPMIKVFPAISQSWPDVRFSRLRAQGAFLVTADRRNGQTAYVIIESEAGAPCWLVHPWPHATVLVCSGDAEIEHQVDAGVIRFETHAGLSYILTPANSGLEDSDVLEVEASKSGLLGIGGRLEAMSWRDFDEVVT